MQNWNGNYVFISHMPIKLFLHVWVNIVDFAMFCFLYFTTYLLKPSNANMLSQLFGKLLVTATDQYLERGCRLLWDQMSWLNSCLGFSPGWYGESCNRTSSAGLIITWRSHQIHSCLQLYFISCKLSDSSNVVEYQYAIIVHTEMI